MQLPVNPPVLPMLAKRVTDLPTEGDWIFEPKWDGFRALVFRDGDEVLIQSRDEKPLERYFPELLEPLRSALPSRCVLDGEIVIVKDSELDFDLLQLRLHPAASRVKLLSRQTPASFVFFDLLCVDDRDLRQEAFQTRRRELYRLPDEGDRRTTTLRAGEVMLELDVPQPDASTYLKAMDRKRWAFPLVGAAAVRRGGETTVALAGVAPIPWLLESAFDDATPLPGTAYKVQIARALVERARAAVA